MFFTYLSGVSASSHNSDTCIRVIGASELSRGVIVIVSLAPHPYVYISPVMRGPHLSSRVTPDWLQALATLQLDLGDLTLNSSYWLLHARGGRVDFGWLNVSFHLSEGNKFSLSIMEQLAETMSGRPAEWCGHPLTLGLLCLSQHRPG